MTYNFLNISELLQFLEKSQSTDFKNFDRLFLIIQKFFERDKLLLSPEKKGYRAYLRIFARLADNRIFREFTLSKYDYNVYSQNNELVIDIYYPE